MEGPDGAGTADDVGGLGLSNKLALLGSLDGAGCVIPVEVDGMELS